LASRTSFHLLLPQLLSDPNYRRHYQSVGGYKILDNGAAEGVRTKMKDLIHLGAVNEVDEIVVPDAMGDADETIKLAREFESHARRYEVNYMGVVQGRTIPEAVKCATALSFMEYITVLGVPRILANTIHRGFRANFARTLRFMYDRQLPIHCLGASNNVREVVLLQDEDIIRSTDTSMPFVLAYKGRHIRDAEYTGRQKKYFDLPLPDLGTRDLMEDNVRTFLEWAGAEPIC
jgi:hypothetical protein